MEMMNGFRFSVLDWVVAVLLTVLAVVKTVLLLTVGQSDDLEWFYFGTRIVYDVVLLWALFSIWRMAKWQERKTGAIMAFIVVMVVNYLFGFANQIPALNGMMGTEVYAVVYGIIGFLILVLGIIVAVQLFKDKVRPLGTIMVLYALLPWLSGIVTPLLLMSGTMVVGHLLSLVNTVVVALLFLFRNTPGEEEED